MSRLLNRYRAQVRRNTGFTLLEVLVAFSILTLSLGVLLTLFSTGLRNTAIAHDYSRAITLAESRLASIGVSEPLQPGESEGRFDDHYRWYAEITPHVGNYDHAIGDTAWQLYKVRVHVIWEGFDGERSVTLSTLRMITVL